MDQSTHKKQTNVGLSPGESSAVTANPQTSPSFVKHPHHEDIISKEKGKRRSDKPSKKRGSRGNPTEGLLLLFCYFDFYSSLITFRLMFHLVGRFHSLLMGVNYSTHRCRFQELNLK
jgi:hypothetical protein